MLKTTIITVVYNAVDKIRATIESVVGQDHNNIEYIIKDGGSSDGTLEIIGEYLDQYSNMKLIEGCDRGIYDAMNVALNEATGDIIEFLNAGDRFASSDVVSKAVLALCNTKSDIVYGDVLYENENGTTNVRAYTKSCSCILYFLTGDVINHQAMFAKKKLFDENRFDISYKICADREWMMRTGAYRPKCRMAALGFTVVIYPLDGVSVINKDCYKREASTCVKKYLPWGYWVYTVFELLRSNKKSSDILHSIYKCVFFKDRV